MPATQALTTPLYQFLVKTETKYLDPARVSSTLQEPEEGQENLRDWMEALVIWLCNDAVKQITENLETNKKIALETVTKTAIERLVLQLNCAKGFFPSDENNHIPGKISIYNFAMIQLLQQCFPQAQTENAELQKTALKLNATLSIYFETQKKAEAASITAQKKVKKEAEKNPGEAATADQLSPEELEKFEAARLAQNHSSQYFYLLLLAQFRKHRDNLPTPSPEQQVDEQRKTPQPQTLASGVHQKTSIYLLTQFSPSLMAPLLGQRAFADCITETGFTTLMGLILDFQGEDEADLINDIQNFLDQATFTGRSEDEKEIAKTTYLCSSYQPEEGEPFSAVQFAVSRNPNLLKTALYLASTNEGLAAQLRKELIKAQWNLFNFKELALIIDHPVANRLHISEITNNLLKVMNAPEFKKAHVLAKLSTLLHESRDIAGLQKKRAHMKTKLAALPEDEKGHLSHIVPGILSGELLPHLIAGNSLHKTPGQQLYFALLFAGKPLSEQEQVNKLVELEAKAYCTELEPGNDYAEQKTANSKQSFRTLQAPEKESPDYARYDFLKKKFDKKPARPAQAKQRSTFPVSAKLSLTDMAKIAKTAKAAQERFLKENYRHKKEGKDAKRLSRTPSKTHPPQPEPTLGIDARQAFAAQQEKTQRRVAAKMAESENKADKVPTTLKQTVG